MNVTTIILNKSFSPPKNEFSMVDIIKINHDMIVEKNKTNLINILRISINLTHL